MWALLLTRRSDPPDTPAMRREIGSGSLLIGRSAADCDWSIEDRSGWLSRRHLTIAVTDDALFVTDVDSTNGVAINDPASVIPPQQPHPLRIGDRILLGELTIAVAAAEPAEIPASTAPKPVERTSAAEPAPPPEDTMAAWHAFCEGAGMSVADLGAGGAESWRTLGKLYAQVVTGLSALMHDRAAFKQEFRIESTMLAMGRNNPLKHLAPAEAARLLLRPPLPGYIPAEEAIAAGFQDVREHHMALLAGVQAVLRDVLDELAPERIEAQAEAIDAARKPSLFASATDRWTVYRATYQALRKDAGSNSSSAASRAFGKGYETYLRGQG